MEASVVLACVLLSIFIYSLKSFLVVFERTTSIVTYFHVLSLAFISFSLATGNSGCL